MQKNDRTAINHQQGLHLLRYHVGHLDGSGLFTLVWYGA
jgi:hypothetical protein